MLVYSLQQCRVQHFQGKLFLKGNLNSEGKNETFCSGFNNNIKLFPERNIYINMKVQLGNYSNGLSLISYIFSGWETSNSNNRI